jgi:palmitoyltransferase ZDHHC13/17
VGNVVGKGNRHLFLLFLWVETVAMTAGLAVACLRLHGLYQLPDSKRGSASLGFIIGFIVADGFMLMSVLALAVTQATQVGQTGGVRHVTAHSHI